MSETRTFTVGQEVRVKPRIRLPFANDNHRKVRSKKLVGRITEIHTPPYDTWVEFPGMARLLDFSQDELVPADE